MGNVIPFRFEANEVRVQIGNDGLTWFNANDICLGIEMANPRDALARHVDQDDVAKRDIIDSLGRTQLTSFVNESRMYALVLGKTKSAVKRFKRWITSVVLPTLRKTTGSYTIPRSFAEFLYSDTH